MRTLGAKAVFLHCNSTYPTPYKDVNLAYLKRLQEITGLCVGYSGHEPGHHVALAAVAMNAKVVEKHLTIDRGMEGDDHKVGLLPGEFKAMVQSIRDIEQAIGEGTVRKITQGELTNRENSAKSLAVNRDLAVGQVIERGMIEIKGRATASSRTGSTRLSGKRSDGI